VGRPRLRDVGLDMACCRALRAVTEIVGGVTADAAALTGLRAGTPVIAGTGDTFRRWSAAAR